MVRMGGTPSGDPVAALAPGRAAGADLSVRFWGTRGSLPVSGPDFVRYGGSTVSIELRCGDACLVFDAGSGIAPAGKALMADGVGKVHLMFTHSHYDHIVGFPFFKPLYDPKTRVEFWSGHLHGKMTTAEMLEDFMRPPWFPVRPDVCPASLGFHDFAPGDVLEPEPGVRIVTRALNHPGGAVGYRVEWNGRVVAVVTDTEHHVDHASDHGGGPSLGGGDLDPAVMDLIRGCDLFLYDASYLDDEMARFRGYGHSTWQHGVRLARAAGARRVGMIHHAPWRTDDELDAIDRAARAEFAGAFVAADGQAVSV
jgi:phosphoribosyl 1,2-cyclic phosphodiesterase